MVMFLMALYTKLHPGRTVESETLRGTDAQPSDCTVKFRRWKGKRLPGNPGWTASAARPGPEASMFPRSALHDWVHQPKPQSDRMRGD
jgi:hypothetical protein